MAASIPMTNYLRTPRFDHFFIWGVPLVAALSVLLVLARPDLLSEVILLDLSFLGYHHVIATFTRVNMSSGSARGNRQLFLYTPVLVVAAVALLALNWGAAAVTTIYLHWQWWHYTRQSEGVAKAYVMKSEQGLAGNAHFNRFTFYSVPVATFLSMSSRNPESFLFSIVYTLPVPQWLASSALVVAGFALSIWLFVQGRAWFLGRLRPLLLAYCVSHYAIYICAYHVISDVTVGWLLINIWHNLQYITFVWVCNVNEFGSGRAPVTKLRAWFCKPSNWFFYFAACYFLTMLVYGGVDRFIGWAVLGASASLPLAVIVYQSINFHHYIVDTNIWKLRKKQTRVAVGVEP